MEILSLGEKIKSKRKELNMTLKDLAKDRITPGQISLVESGRSNPSMDLLEYLADNLNTTVEYLMESEESQAEKISLYYEQIAEVYILNKNFLKSQRYIDQALEYATQYNLEYTKARIMCLRADVLKYEKKFEEVQYLYLSAILIYVKCKKHEQIIKIFLKLGNVSIDLKSFLSANSYFIQAEAIYLENNIGNENLLGEIYYNLSKVNYLIEKIAESKKYAYLAKEKIQKMNDKEEYAKSLLLLAEESSNKGDLSAATIYSTKSLTLYREIEESSNICNIQNNLGELFYNFEDLNKSYTQFDSAIKMSKSNKNNNIDILINICKNDLKIKDLTKCEELLKNLYERIDKTDIERTISLNLIKYRILTINEKLEEAESLLIKSYNLAKEKDKLKIAGQLSILISKFYSDNKKEELAKKFLDEGVRIFRNLGIV